MVEFLHQHGPRPLRDHEPTPVQVKRPGGLGRIFVVGQGAHGAETRINHGHQRRLRAAGHDGIGIPASNGLEGFAERVATRCTG